MEENLESRTRVPEDNRNVIQHYKYWETEAIKADLDTKRHNYSILCSNLGNDFNIATVIRNSNAFMAERVMIYGSKRYDKRGTVGTHNYSRIVHYPENALESIVDDLRDFHIVAVDNIPRAVPIETYAWPTDKHVVMIFGQEQIGIPQCLLDIAHDVVYISQYGSVRSLNVGTASGIAMYDYCRKVVSVAQENIRSV